MPVDAVLIDKRERILIAASKLIVKNGLQCSMSEIAQTAGVATGSLYNYFTSKDDLVRGVYDRLTKEIAAILVRDFPDNISHEQRVRGYIDAYIEFIWTDPARAILFEYLSNVPLLAPGELRQLFSPVSDYTSRIFGEAKEAGVLREWDTHFMGAFVGGGIRNTLKWRRADGADLSEAERQQIANMCWAMVSA
jgi:AcrR family transcriptional regulator